MRLLRFRSRALDAAVVLAALAGGLTCSTILALFLGKGGASILFALFGGAVLFTLGAIGAFVLEMLLAARGVRLAVDHTLN